MAKKASAAQVANRKAFKKRTDLAKKIWNEKFKGKPGKTFADAIKEASKQMKK